MTLKDNSKVAALTVLQTIFEHAFGAEALTLELEATSMPKKPVDPRIEREFQRVVLVEIRSGLVDVSALSGCLRLLRKAIAKHELPLSTPPDGHGDRLWCNFASTMSALFKLGCHCL